MLGKALIEQNMGEILLSSHNLFESRFLVVHYLTRQDQEQDS